MTKPVDPQTRKRRRRIVLSAAPGTVAALIPQYAAELGYGLRHQKNVRHACRELLEVLGDEPRPADFSAANLDSLQIAMESRNAAHVHVMNTLQVLKRLWAWLADRGLADQPPLLYRPQGKPGNRFGRPLNHAPPVEAKQREVSYLPDKPLAVDVVKPPRQAAQPSAEPDSLWTICQTVYFPARPRVGPKTKRHYRSAICRFEQMLGHASTLADLTDDNLTALMRFRLDSGRAPETINGEVGRLVTLWTWLAKRGHTKTFPAVENLHEPRRIPLAWRREELDRLMVACHNAEGFISGKPASDWFTALLLTIWDARGERISAALAIRREWIHWNSGDMIIPAEARKGAAQDMACNLSPPTLAALRRIVDADDPLVFGHPDQSTIYRAFKQIRVAAGLSTDRRSGFHRLRRSLATHLEAAGIDPTAALGHSSREVTRKSYIDPRIAGQVNPAASLPFRLGQPATEPAPPAPPAAASAPLDDAALAWL